MRHYTKTFFLLLSILASTVYAQEKREYSTDIFGNKVYKCNEYEEKLGKDIMGNYQYENNRNEKASLEKDIFGGMAYSDSNGNEIKYGKTQWAEQMRKWDNDEEGFFMYMIDRFMKNRKKEFRKENDFPKNEIHSSDYGREEYRKDIMGDWQYRNNDGQTASLHIDAMGDLNYSDSEDNKVIIKKRSNYTHRRSRLRTPEEIFRHFVRYFLSER